VLGQVLVGSESFGGSIKLYDYLGWSIKICHNVQAKESKKKGMDSTYT